MDQPARKPRFRFSLTTLVLLTTIVGMGLVIGKLAPYRSEALRLRNEAGHLTIRDRAKIHAIQVESGSPFVWKWKVYVPPGSDALCVGAVVGPLPPLNDEEGWPTSLRITMKDGFEQMLTCRIYKDLHDAWLLQTRFGGVSTRQSLTESEVAKIRDSGGSSTSGVGASTTVEETGKPLVLLRKVYDTKEEAQSRGVTYREEGDGVFIWLAREP